MDFMLSFVGIIKKVICNLHSIFQLRFILKDYFLTGRYIKCCACNIF